LFLAKFRISVVCEEAYAEISSNGCWRWS